MDRQFATSSVRSVPATPFWGAVHNVNKSMVKGKPAAYNVIKPRRAVLPVCGSGGGRIPESDPVSMPEEFPQWKRLAEMSEQEKFAHSLDVAVVDKRLALASRRPESALTCVAAMPRSVQTRHNATPSQMERLSLYIDKVNSVVDSLDAQSVYRRLSATELSQLQTARLSLGELMSFKRDGNVPLDLLQMLDSQQVWPSPEREASNKRKRPIVDGAEDLTREQLHARDMHTLSAFKDDIQEIITSIECKGLFANDHLSHADEQLLVNLKRVCHKIRISQYDSGQARDLTFEIRKWQPKIESYKRAKLQRIKNVQVQQESSEERKQRPENQREKKVTLRLTVKRRVQEEDSGGREHQVANSER